MVTVSINMTDICSSPPQVLKRMLDQSVIIRFYNSSCLLVDEFLVDANLSPFMHKVLPSTGCIRRRENKADEGTSLLP
ncbi:hypothetical protein M378DRAFT_158161 [Amanita muscaria Koide BX008]|uniref:Uncharacterized protein n=1 Tax=Amanita muscaria (strain Koide BX008) TaxID=946122 RepID=A0A0C2SXX4_AMAMK|nr:hypothetical protein M378DRAFT_158161 [Amanita muscaria Koide BX008]